MIMTGGSSPRVRGTHHGFLSLILSRRFIPARAGNTVARDISGDRCAVHPRACGEHLPTSTTPTPWRGSSPRVRGTQQIMEPYTPPDRFIPARAGNTRLPSPPCPKAPVHPRACGEHTSISITSSLSAGSSPRVRGTRNQPGPGPRGKRFIPARAGNTKPPCRPGADQPVHPRACGEHSPGLYTHQIRFGSSPRVRGTLAEHKPDELSSSVHPRACGEHK